MNPDRVGGAGGNNKRDRSTVKRLQMYRNFKAKRDSTGHIITPAPFQSRLTPGTVARVEPNRRWFGNTRVITQSALQTFQEEMKKAMKDPYKVVLNQTKLPISLLNEKAKNRRVHILDMESFEQTFGSKAQRKRPKVPVSDMESLLKRVEESSENYKESDDKDRVVPDPGFVTEASELIFKAGQSRRIWNELYKVIDSADVVAQVLDARDPQGTRSKHIEDYLRKEKSHKQLVFILNKVDLVPTFVTEKWVATLSAEYPTMAFHASVKNPFGRGALINLLRQFGKLHADKKQISVGFIGYPNVGKSSVINTLRAKKVCNVAPIAGETKVWQYVTLMKRIFLIDCPGVVYPTGDSETDTVLKGVVRVENIKCPEDHIVAVLDRVEKRYITATYGVTDWTSPEHFLEQIAYKSGRLLKGGQPDISTVARMVLNDWQRGKIPFYVRPPDSQKTEVDEKSKASGDGVQSATTETPAAPPCSLTIKQDMSRIKLCQELSGDANVTDGALDETQSTAVTDDSVVADEEDDDYDDDDDDDDDDEDEEQEEREDTEMTRVEQPAGCSLQAETSTRHSSNKKHATDKSVSRKRKSADIARPQKGAKKVRQSTRSDRASRTAPTLIKTSSGTFVVTDDATEPVVKSKNIEESKTRVKKQKRAKVAKAPVEEEQVQEKPSGKQKRQLYEASKVKRIGQHFYATANVKNRRDRS